MQFYFFTRTGRSRSIAETMGKTHDKIALEIVDEQNWQGVRGFLKGGKMSSLKESVNAQFVTPEEGETVVLVFPLWASSFPPAVREFVNQVGKENIIAVPTSLGSRLKEADRNGFIQVIDLVGKEIQAPQPEVWEEK